MFWVKHVRVFYKPSNKEQGGDVEIYNKSPLVGGYLILIGMKGKIIAI